MDREETGVGEGEEDEVQRKTRGGGSTPKAQHRSWHRDQEPGEANAPADLLPPAALQR